jgi:DNA-binding LytR/AlgR family response regulator
MDIPALHLKFVVIDDDETDREVIEAEAARFPFLLKKASCGNALEALEVIKNTDPDVVFLDIEMPGMNGIEFIKAVSTTALPVFITSHPEFALESYELDAFDYLLKPVSSERFARCALRLHDFFQMKAKSYAFDSGRDADCIIIKQGYDKYKIAVGDILYLEAMRDYTKIITVAKQYLVLTTLSGLVEKLPAGIFVRIHRSYVVNKHKVDAVQKNKIIIQSCELPIGKLYKFILDFPV